MQVVEAVIKWRLASGNTQDLYLLVDREPPLGEFEFEFLPDDRNDEECSYGWYYADLGGYVRFIHHTGYFDGYDMPGQWYEIRVKGASEMVRVFGHMNHNAAYLHRETYFPPVMHVHATDDPEVWEKGHTYWAGSCCEVKWLQAELDRVRPDLLLQFDADSWHWYPTYGEFPSGEKSQIPLSKIKAAGDEDGIYDGRIIQVLNHCKFDTLAEYHAWQALSWSKARTYHIQAVIDEFRATRLKDVRPERLCPPDSVDMRALYLVDWGAVQLYGIELHLDPNYAAKVEIHYSRPGHSYLALR